MNALGKAIAMLLLGLVCLSMLVTFLFSRPNNPDTYYDVLGLNTVQATNKEIRQQYRTMVKTMHPDYRRHLSPEERALKDRYTIEQVNQAYKVLSNPQQRIRYDYTLSSPGNFHHDVYSKSMLDKVPRCYEYNSSWDSPGYRPYFAQIDQVLRGYEKNFPQWSKMAREIYTKNASENDELDTVEIKPYILEKSKGYDNVVTYHFSDWQDQLDKPRQNLINMGSIIFSIVSAVVPIWFVCSDSGEKKDDVDLTGLVLDEEGNPVEMSVEEYQEAGWSADKIKAHQAALKEKANLDRMNKILEIPDEKMRDKELARMQKQILAEKKKEKMAEAIRKAQKAGAGGPKTAAAAAAAAALANATCASDEMVQDGDADAVVAGEAAAAAAAANATAIAEKEAAKKAAQPAFVCYPCKKSYHTEQQYEQHIASSKHLKAVKDAEKKKK